MVKQSLENKFKNFQSGYSSLNNEQKRAVDSLEGPVMVLAGPGTGKTHLLSHRVANILRQKKAEAEHILCLTYTNAGATEMQNKLEKLIGLEARKVRISTLHSFCEDLIRKYPDVFKTDHHPRLMSETMKFSLLKEVMDEHIKDDNVLYRDSGDRYWVKGQLLNLYSKMKVEGLSKEKFEDPVSRLKAGLDVVEAFDKRIKAENFYDYDDMILWVKDALNKNPTFQAEVSSDIHYLFVDEFQDTSTVQYELIKLLMKEKSQPNIFVVGDDDQRIFGFQGATEDNFAAFNSDFEQFQVKSITLEKNYRSSQVILDASRELMEASGQAKELIAVGNNKDICQKPQLLSYKDETSEMSGIVQRVKELLTENTVENPSEIGIIYGRNSYGKTLAQLFRDNKIPVQIKEKTDLLTDPFFVKLLDILTYLSNENLKIDYLRKILFYDFFDISVLELVTLRTAEDIKDNEKIQKYDKQLDGLRKRIKKLSALASLRLVIKELGIDHYLVNSTNRYHLSAVLSDMIQLMSDLGEDISLEDFLKKVNSLKVMKVELPINELDTDENCVQLMTAHGSKGREFDYVFMVNCIDNNASNGAKWPGGENKNAHFAYPPSLKQVTDAEENRRLFYVGMTRAKKSLTLSYYHEGNTDKTKYLVDLKESVENHGIENSDKSTDKKNSIVLSKLSDEVINSSEFHLSVSTINSFLACPLSFYLNKCLELPFEGNESSLFGLLMHETLEGLYLSEEKDGQNQVFRSPLSKEAAIELFEKLLDEKSDGLLTNHLRQVLKIRGTKILDNFYKQGYFKTDTDVKIALEKEIKLNLPVAGLVIPIKGIIDKVEETNHKVTLIDYKTGKPGNAKEKLKPSSEDNPLGGDYWRQAVFYYILWTNSHSPGKTIQVKYILLEGSKEEQPKEFSTEELEAGKEIVLEQLVETYKRISKGKFNQGCGQVEEGRSSNHYACSHCKFVQLNHTLDKETYKRADEARRQYVKHKLSLSVSELNRFLSCPLSLYFDKVLSLTQSLNLNIGYESKSTDELDVKGIGGPIFGTIMHEVLEEIYLQSRFETSDVRQIFDTIFEKYGHKFDKQDEVKKYAYSLLDNLVKSYFTTSCKDVETEKLIKINLGDTYQLEGIIDKIEYDGDVVRIVDYKTGSAHQAKQELKKGGKYWRQAVFYNILLTESGCKNLSNKKLETQYILLDDDSSGKGYSVQDITIEESDIALVKEEIKEFYSSLDTMELREGCQKNNCDYCRLVSLINNESDLSGLSELNHWVKQNPEIVSQAKLLTTAQDRDKDTHYKFLEQYPLESVKNLSIEDLATGHKDNFLSAVRQAPYMSLGNALTGWLLTSETKINRTKDSLEGKSKTPGQELFDLLHELGNDSPDFDKVKDNIFFGQRVVITKLLYLYNSDKYLNFDVSQPRYQAIRTLFTGDKQLNAYLLNTEIMKLLKKVPELQQLNGIQIGHILQEYIVNINNEKGGN